MTLLYAYRRNERGGVSSILVDKKDFPTGPGWYDSPDKIPREEKGEPRPLIEPLDVPLMQDLTAPPQHPSIGQETHLANSDSAGMTPHKRPVGRPPKHPRG